MLNSIIKMLILAPYFAKDAMILTEKYRKLEENLGGVSNYKKRAVNNKRSPD